MVTFQELKKNRYFSLALLVLLLGFYIAIGYLFGRMKHIILFLSSIPGAYLWFISSDAQVPIIASQQIFHPFTLGFISASGQTVGFMFGYYFGHALLRFKMFTRLRERINTFDIERFKASKYLLLITGSILGFPPISVVSIFAGMIQFNFYTLFTFVWIGRTIRYLTLAYLSYHGIKLFG